MPVRFSPAALAGLNFNIEQVDHPSGCSVVTVAAVGPHRLAAAGIRAVAARANTYIGTTLTTAQVQALLNTLPDGLLHVGQTYVKLGCNTADTATLTAGFASDLQAAGAVVFG